MINGSFHQKEITILNVYIPNKSEFSEDMIIYTQKNPVDSTRNY